jgi:hypothetical protein
MALATGPAWFLHQGLVASERRMKTVFVSMLSLGQAITWPSCPASVW